LFKVSDAEDCALTGKRGFTNIGPENFRVYPARFSLAAYDAQISVDASS
jgi:hypothetical protein